MKRYVVGFLFSDDQRHVVLIKKNRPAWQEGKYNGVGGHIEPAEEPYYAMQREFREEAGITVPWEKFLVLKGSDYEVNFFWSLGDITKCRSMTDEPIGFFPVNNLPKNIIDNLPWIINLLFDSHRKEYKIIDFCGNK
jgi:8-oxo-dGTP diphosphatase